jgi:hypothetical protein
MRESCDNMEMTMSGSMDDLLSVDFQRSLKNPELVDSHEVISVNKKMADLER